MELAVANVHRTAEGLKEAMESFLIALDVLGGKAAKGISALFGPKRMRTMPSIPVFVVGKHFRPGPVDGVSIYAISDNFKDIFSRVVEKDVPSATIFVRKLRKGAYGESVYKELDTVQGIALAHFWELLRSHSRPFIVVLCRGQFICAHWRQDREGWSIETFPVTSRLLRMYTGDPVVTG